MPQETSKPDQIDKFRKAAREHETDESEKRFDKKLEKLAKRPSDHKGREEDR